MDHTLRKLQSKFCHLLQILKFTFTGYGVSNWDALLSLDSCFSVKHYFLVACAQLCKCHLAYTPFMPIISVPNFQQNDFMAFFLACKVTRKGNKTKHIHGAALNSPTKSRAPLINTLPNAFHPTPRTSARKMYIIRPLCRTNKLHSSRRTKRLTELHYFRFLSAACCLRYKFSNTPHRPLVSHHYQNYSHCCCVVSCTNDDVGAALETRSQPMPHDLFACSGACWGDPHTPTRCCWAHWPRLWHLCVQRQRRNLPVTCILSNRK